MPKLRFGVFVGVIAFAACSSTNGSRPGLLTGSYGSAGTPAQPGTAGSGAAGSPSAAAGSFGAAGAVAQGSAGSGAPAAGSGRGGAPELGGASGAGASVAGRGVPVAGMSAAGSGGAVAGSGAAGAAGSGGTAALAGSGGAPAAGSGGGGPGSVSVQFTTLSYRGQYAPLNYGAVWFERSDGTFVKTAKRWAGAAHATDLVAWTEASGGWGSLFGGGNSADMVDAVSSATLRTHQMHTVTWNMLDAQKQPVPDGSYVAVIEMSESRARDQPGPVLRIPFMKGAMPQTVMVPDAASFTGVSLSYTP